MFFGLFRSKPNLFEQLGFKTEKAERDTPVLNNDGTFSHTEREECIRYSLQKPGGRFGDWQLLQKFPKDDQRLPNGYQAFAANATPELIDKLMPLAKEFKYDYFEFERTGDTVSIYCWTSSKTELQALARAMAALEA
jgi:hypothetical protein